MPPTNNVTRMLESKKIRHTAFETPAEKLGALKTARLLGMPPEQVFKTIVAKRDKPGKALLAVIPGGHALDLKALATALGEKKVHLVTQREAEQLTGLQAGGISPLALINKGFQVLIDSSAQTLDQMHVSGGQRGLNIRLAPADLAKLVNARFAPIASPEMEVEEDEAE
jgi:Cys-tRNA(Pro)/Cys-tRNA(Cys) deacylase